MFDGLKLDALKQKLSRRTLLSQTGWGILTAGIAGVVGVSTKPIRTLAQAAPAATKEPALPPDQRLGWAVVGLGKFATEQILPPLTWMKWFLRPTMDELNN